MASRSWLVLLQQWPTPNLIFQEQDLISALTTPVAWRYKTITLDADYFFGGEKEEGTSFNANLGAGLVFVNYKEKLKGTPPAGEQPLYPMENGDQTGFTINLGLGTQYAIDDIKVFANAGVAIPANKVNDQDVGNLIPLQIMLNTGVRFALGQGSND